MIWPAVVLASLVVAVVVAVAVQMKALQLATKSPMPCAGPYLHDLPSVNRHARCRRCGHTVHDLLEAALA